MTITLLNGPDYYQELVAPVPEGVRFVDTFEPGAGFIHLFETDAIRLESELRRCLGSMDPKAVIWVSWPKKTARVPTTITEDVIREVALPMGLVDIKVCAVDAVWSGLKLVIRRSQPTRP